MPEASATEMPARNAWRNVGSLPLRTSRKVLRTRRKL